MPYNYKRDDIFYDVESLSNVFTVAWWYPHKDMNAIILSYIDDDNIIKGDADLEVIRQRIYELHPNLVKNNVQVFFEDIGQTGYITENNPNGPQFGAKPGMQTFAKRLGLTNEKTYLNASVHRRDVEGGGNKYDPAYFPVKDTDPDYDESAHGLRFGYNSTNYDLTILAYMMGFLHDRTFTKAEADQPVYWDRYKTSPIQAGTMRKFNDELFESEWKSSMAMRLAQTDDPNAWGNFKDPGWIMRKGWLLSGRYVDVARLNEKLQKVGLKRLLGMLGLHIMESDKLDVNSEIKTLDEFADLLAYNISDVVNLQVLFEHKVYQNAIRVRKQLMKTYPQTVYGAKKGPRQNPDLEPQVDTGNYMNIRRDRLGLDSTSAKFVEFALAPYVPIKDIEKVSFMYPSELEAKKLGIERTDILGDTKKFFENTVTADPNDPAHQDFMEVYRFYDAIRGRNFNESAVYAEHYPYDTMPSKDRKYVNELMQTYNTNLFYHHKDKFGNVYRSSCLANFSIGGIHGAEVNVKKYEFDLNIYRIEKEFQDYVEALYESATDALNGPIWIDVPEHLEVPERIRKKIRTGDNMVKIREFVKSGSTKTNAVWRDVPEVQLFKKSPNGTYAVQDKYKYVSVGPSHHEDFTSYYPLLLSRLSAFINPSYHGYYEDGSPADPYYEMFLERVAKKKESKDMSKSAEERNLADIEQDSRKLLINAASGAGDATFDNNIRANNAVISMRIIGQLFAWRIGQAQTMAGARVPSTNTDGLYTMDISAEENDRILEEISADMHIGIEPERLDRFVSKDSNNRIEVYGGEITSASGGTLKSWVGPDPTQSLDHAAIIDHILAKYLADLRLDNPANAPFDKAHAEKMFYEFIQDHVARKDFATALRFFQWIISSSSGTHRYNYLKRVNKHTGEYEIKNLQMYNRIFLIKDTDPNIRQEAYLATRRVVGKPVWTKRTKQYQDGEIARSALWEHDDDALAILKANGLNLSEHNADPSSEHHVDEAKTQKIRTMPTEQHIGVFNESIVDLPDDIALRMLQELDIDAYLTILESTFKSWANETVPDNVAI